MSGAFEWVQRGVPRLHALDVAAGIGVVQARHGLADRADFGGCEFQRQPADLERRERDMWKARASNVFSRLASTRLATVIV